MIVLCLFWREKSIIESTLRMLLKLSFLTDHAERIEGLDLTMVNEMKLLFSGHC